MQLLTKGVLPCWLQVGRWGEELVYHMLHACLEVGVVHCSDYLHCSLPAVARQLQLQLQLQPCIFASSTPGSNSSSAIQIRVPDEILAQTSRCTDEQATARASREPETGNIRSARL